MTQLPDILHPFQSQAEEYLAKGLVQDIEFADGTYQVHVIDANSEQSVWTFLQLDSRGGLKDCFCSCEEEDSDTPATHCVHLAAAYLRIYNNHPTPLHERFQLSLWNQLCRLYADRLGDDPTLLLKMSPGYYMHASAGGRVVFYVKGKTETADTRLQEIIEERQKETEETSLKFSNLPPDELTLWREGRPSAQLKYELSFWNDFAHWLMQLQDEEAAYKINFSYSQKRIPNEITITFPDVEMSFYISEANLPLIVEALTTVKSPLSVHHVSQDTIKRITYDEAAATLVIEPQETEKGKGNQKTKKIAPKVGQILDGWLYIPGDGFYAQERHRLLATPKIPEDKIAEALNAHLPVIQSRLEGTALYPEPIKLSYSVYFDSKWNLHIVAYAFAPGDLNRPHSRYFEDWIYLEDTGFYRIEENHFGQVDTIISTRAVEDFIRNERSWLNAQEGFYVHLESVEAQLCYHLSADNCLTFSRLAEVKNSEKANKEFGSWVYIAGKGFYSKVNAYSGIKVRSDLVINADQIPLFIRMNRQELQWIPHFFTERSPISKMGLNISLVDDRVTISPVCEFLPEYANKDVRFFDDVVYIGGEGFYELPTESQLPERFRHAIQLEPDMLPIFFSYELGIIEQYVLKIDPHLVRPIEINLRAEDISKAETQGWYALKLGYKTKHAFVPLNTISVAQSKKKRFLFTDAGLLDLDDRKFKWMRQLPKNRLDKRKNVLLLSTLELIRLHALEGLEASEEAYSSQNLLHELTEFRIPSEPDLTGLKSELRAYQKLGVHWLWFLYQHNLSGLLCDDMGLGKTHQSMALLAAIMNAKKGVEGNSPHFLIVCPTSVIFHWQEKLESFLPGIRVCVFYGANRSLEEFHQQYDVLLTSYGIWRIENELLSTVPFEVAIFDEIQIAKNHNSRVHYSLLTARAKMRLGLTGTPIENHLRELKALFDLVLPAYMPGDVDYRELFVRPIEKEGRQERRDLLKRFIKPFVLRRKKEDVLLDLPEKTEEIAHCVLLPDQQHLYTAAVNQSREYLLQRLQDSESSIPYVHVFALLSSLKQICNHPAAYLKTPEEYKKYSSGKWELFVELLDEARESGQKVVIFSQYLAMLDIFELYLNELGMGFSTIRGATINRGEQVRRFNNDPDCEVFLGSLQAAGLGVDLTAGSVVIHYDRWWNAARENQATDRVHRIGQVRGVQVFKMVTKGTFEERIDELISQKARLMEDVVGVDDHRFLKQFSREELIQLLTLNQ
jgi:superfamily II DNA or RNA helicase